MGKSGKFVAGMELLYGEFSCRLDEKGRFLLPAALLSQLSPGSDGEFVFAKGPDPCLLLFPKTHWQAELERIYRHSYYDTRVRTLLRLFQNGATPAKLDKQNRLLIPKRLMEYAHLQNDLLLIGMGNKVEIWSPTIYEQWLENQGVTLKELSEQILGKDGPCL